MTIVSGEGSAREIPYVIIPSNYGNNDYDITESLGGVESGAVVHRAIRIPDSYRIQEELSEQFEVLSQNRSGSDLEISFRHSYPIGEWVRHSLNLVSEDEKVGKVSLLFLSR